MSFLKRLGLSALTALVALLVVGCDGSNSSSGGGPQPPAAATDLLVYRSYTNPAQLYKLDTAGKATMLSDALVSRVFTDGTDFVVSPDRELVAFSYTLGDGRYALGIKRIRNGELVEPNPVFDGLVPTSISWRPDSRGLVFDVQTPTEICCPKELALYLATLGEVSTIKLMGDDTGSVRFRYAMSTDGSALAVEASEPIPDQAPEIRFGSLYLLDLASPGSPLLLETLSVDANYFKLAWSPYANELLYQQRAYAAPSDRFTPNDFARGPLMLADIQGSTRALRGVDDPWYVDWTWLDAQKILVVPRTRFVIIDTDGNLRAEHLKRGPVVPSADRGKLAFLDATDQPEAGTRVYALDIHTLEYRELGPGRVISGYPQVSQISELQWSPDSTQLAWNSLQITDDGVQSGELYAYDFVESRTWSLIARQSAPPSLPLFSWLPDGGALDFYQRAGDAYQFSVADLATDNTRVLGSPCGLTPAWRSNTEVLWNPCGEGLSLSELKDGAFHNTRLLDTEARNLTLTLNRNIAVVHPAVFDDDNTTMYVPDANWQAYDFATGRLQDLEGTGGTPCCGILLQ